MTSGRFPKKINKKAVITKHEQIYQFLMSAMCLDDLLLIAALYD